MITNQVFTGVPLARRTSSHGLFDDDEDQENQVVSNVRGGDFVVEDRVDEELGRWFADTQRLQILEDGSNEPVLEFWKRQHDKGKYIF
mgnify:CR=1 FL=1